MNNIFNSLYDLIINIISSSNIYGPLFACFLIMIESIIPVLPLFVFITIVFVSYGYVIGFIISYILTVIGCSLAFFLFRYLFRDTIILRLRKKAKLNSLINKIDNISISTLTVIMAIPFTPAFLINIATSLSNYSYKRYLICLIVAKPFLVFFWGFIGTGLIESLKHPENILIIFIMLLVSFILSKLVMKYFDK